MTKVLTTIAALIGISRVLGAQDLGSISGTVRDTAGVAIGGANVNLDNKHILTTPQGGFRFDSLSAGTHLITVRMVGYSPLRSPVTVRSGNTHYDFVLHAAPTVLPTVSVEASRAGIYGTVGDTSFRPLSDVKLQLAGGRAGFATTSPSGGF